MRKITILGSTGSIGTTTLGVVDRFPERLDVFGLACWNNQKEFVRQISRFRPAVAALGSGEPTSELRQVCNNKGCQLLLGEKGIIELAGQPDPDIVVAAMLGASGLKPTLTALKSGKHIALANKEVMVMAGELVSAEAAKAGALILPVDSEHNAIFQCLRGEERESLSRILLSASGGPFLNRDPASFEKITVEEALNHPRWKMGEKITIDSATMINKGLEMIEARWLFSLNPSQIAVIVHPQSIVHSMVEFRDGSIIGQLGRTDMALPIQYCLSFPERWPSPERKLNLIEMEALEFSELDYNRFPVMKLAEKSLRDGGTLPAVLNAADEVAVEAFLGGRISFPSITKVIESTMQKHDNSKPVDLDEIMAADDWARRTAQGYVQKYSV